MARDKYFLIQPYSCQRYKDTLELHSYGLPVPFNSLEFITRTGEVFGSSNGLICVRKCKAVFYF